MKKVITSEIDKRFSVTIYPLSIYKNGNGFWYHYTDTDNAMTGLELKDLAGKKVWQELGVKAREIWAMSKKQLEKVS